MNKFQPQVLFAADGVGGGGSPAPSSAPSAPSGGDAGSPSSSEPSAASSTPSGEGAPVAPAPSLAPTPGVDGSGNGDFPDFGAFSVDEGEDDDVLPAAPAKAAGQTPPTEKPPEAPPSQPTVPPAEPPKPQEPAPQPPPPTGQQEARPPLSPAEPAAIAESLVQNEAQLIDHLAQNDFKLSQEDIEALQDNASAYVPKLLARTFVRAQVGALRQMAQVVPAMVQTQMKVMRQNMQNEQAFYSRWPDIKPDKHGEIVSKYASLYRKANPSATREQMIEDLGPMIMMAAKIAPTPTHVAPGQPQSQLRPPQPTPFKPAMPGVASTPAPVVDDPWAGMNPAIELSSNED